MTRKNPAGTLILVALAAFALFAGGCDAVEDFIDNYTIQDVDYTQSIYSGTTTSGFGILTLAKNAEVSSLAVVEVNAVSVSPIRDNIFAKNLGLDEVDFSLVGQIENTSENAGRVYLFLAPSSTPAESESFLIGSIWIDAGEIVGFVGSENFDQTPEEIDAGFMDFFATYPDREVLHVFLYGEGVHTDSLLVHSLSLHADPTFLKSRRIPGISLGNDKQKLEDIVRVGVSGTFRNLGNAPAHVLWLVNLAGEEASLEENLVIDTWLAPGEKIDASEGLVVPEGLKRLSSYMEDMMGDGKDVEGTLIITSESNVNVEVKNLKVEIEAKVNIYDIDF